LEATARSGAAHGDHRNAERAFNESNSERHPEGDHRKHAVSIDDGQESTWIKGLGYTGGYPHHADDAARNPLNSGPEARAR